MKNFKKLLKIYFFFAIKVLKVDQKWLQFYENSIFVSQIFAASRRIVEKPNRDLSEDENRVMQFTWQTLPTNWYILLRWVLCVIWSTNNWFFVQIDSLFFYREANCFATILFLWFIAEFFVVLPIQLTFFVCVTRKSNSNANKNIISSEYVRTTWLW